MLICGRLLTVCDRLRSFVVICGCLLSLPVLLTTNLVKGWKLRPFVGLKYLDSTCFYYNDTFDKFGNKFAEENFEAAHLVCYLKLKSSWATCKTEELICWMTIAKVSSNCVIAPVESLWKGASSFISWMNKASLWRALSCFSRCRSLLSLNFRTGFCSEKFLFLDIFLVSVADWVDFLVPRSLIPSKQLFSSPSSSWSSALSLSFGVELILSGHVPHRSGCVAGEPPQI